MSPPTRVSAPQSSALSSFLERQSARLRDRAAPTATLLYGLRASARPQRLTLQAARDLAETCAPATPSPAMTAIVRVESDFRPLLIGVNGANRRAIFPGSKAEAVDTARRLIARGYSIDLGLAQINSRNLMGLGLSVEDAFDPCRNLAGAAQVLDRGYESALKIDRPNRPLLQTAYSLYNSGSPDRGLDNGYVARVESAGRRSGGIGQ